MKCPNCNHELKQLEGTHKFAVQLSDKQYQDEELQYCYEKGFDNIKNGSNVTNSNYAIFSTKEKLNAWQHGRDDANHENTGVKKQ